MTRFMTRCAARRLPLAFAAAALVLVSAPAMAHEGEPGQESAEDSAAHARADLAGVPMSTIERETRANARRIAAAGPAPQLRTKASVGAGVSADPGESGQWGGVVDTPIVPAFQALLPSGKVLMWDSVGDGATESSPDQTFTRAMVWNPSDNTLKRVDVQGYNIFCAGYAQLPDGNVLVVGGNKNMRLQGIRQTHLFNWRTETWSRGPDMASERWYPAVAALASGEAVIIGGGSNRAEVYQEDGQLRTLTGFSSFGARLYAMLVPRLDGRVEMVGPNKKMTTMTTTGVGELDRMTNRDSIGRKYGSFASYLPGKTLVAGGGDLSEDGETDVPTRTAVVVDTSGSGTTVTPTESMAFPRRQHNLTLLADGSVLATGGMRKAVDGLVDLANPVLAAERWDPATGAWTTLAPAARIREYHSAATLLPDGRVLTGGGGICKVCVTKGYLEKNVEYFTPPYLVKKDGSGLPATRPTLTSVPEAISVGSSFTAVSPVASDIRKVALVRLGAATHSVDQGQRYVPLDFSVAGVTLTVQAPTDLGVAPPGYYMLFAIDAQGVPSVASMVRVGPFVTPPATVDLALGRPAGQSSTAWSLTQTNGFVAYDAARAVDGRTDGTLDSGSVSQTNADPWSWWAVDLGASRALSQVVVWNRTDSCCSAQLSDYWIFASDEYLLPWLTPEQQAARPGVWSVHRTGVPSPSTTIDLPSGLHGRYVAVQQGRAFTPLGLAEVQVLGPDPGTQ